MSTLLIVLALGLVAGVAAYATGTLGRMGQAPPDREPAELPDDRSVLPADVDRVRFAIGFRGYRMDQVDGILDRLAAELDERDDYIGELSAALTAAGAPVPERPERARSEAGDVSPDEATEDAAENTTTDEASDSTTDPTEDPVEDAERADA